MKTMHTPGRCDLDLRMIVDLIGPNYFIDRLWVISEWKEIFMEKFKATTEAPIGRIDVTTFIT